LRHVNLLSSAGLHSRFRGGLEPGMGRRVVIVQGHPDKSPERFCRALAGAYEKGARSAGHEVRRIDVASLRFDLVRSQAEWQSAKPPADIRAAQDDIGWAEHIVLIYPLWLGTMPALLKGFLEQLLRPGFATPEMKEDLSRLPPPGRLKGRSARVVVTMGMPALAYRWFFGAHSLKSLERNILKFVGITPIRESLVGLVGVKSDTGRKRWLQKMETLGQEGR
jgi:putative NADPH-quinone reductase